MTDQDRSAMNQMLANAGLVRASADDTRREIEKLILRYSPGHDLVLNVERRYAKLCEVAELLERMACFVYHRARREERRQKRLLKKLHS